MKLTLFSILLFYSFLFSEQKILPSDGNELDCFGQSVSMSNEWIAVSANKSEYNDINSGSVYLYQTINDSLIYETRIFPSDGEYNDYFGKSISIFENWLIVSSIYDNENGYKSGSVYIYYYDGINWLEHSKLFPSDGESSERFGYSIDIYDGHIAVGAIFDDDIAESGGSVYIYQLNENNQWTLNNKLFSNSIINNNNFGKKLSLYNNWLAVSSNTLGNENIDNGIVDIFYFEDNSWTHHVSIEAPDLDNFDYFGKDLDIDNNFLVIGSGYDDDQGSNSGAVYFYKLVDQDWNFIQKIFASDANVNDNFGLSVSIFNNWLAVGSIDDDNGINSGSAYIFSYENNTFVEKSKIIPFDGNNFDEYSNSLNIYNNNLIVGAKNDDDNGIDSGSAYFYIFKGCEDINACNNGNFINSDENQCIYPENGFDCNGDCFFEIDECGVCGGYGNNGDANLDGIVNIIDVIIIIDHILLNTDINICLIDLNQNYVINITDIIILLENILND